MTSSHDGSRARGRVRLTSMVELGGELRTAELTLPSSSPWGSADHQAYLVDKLTTERNLLLSSPRRQAHRRAYLISEFTSLTCSSPSLLRRRDHHQTYLMNEFTVKLALVTSSLPTSSWTSSPHRQAHKRVQHRTTPRLNGQDYTSRWLKNN